VPGVLEYQRTLAPIAGTTLHLASALPSSPKATDGFLAKVTGGADMMSIRGGYGIFYYQYSDATGFVELGDVSFMACSTQALYLRGSRRPIIDAPQGIMVDSASFCLSLLQTCQLQIRILRSIGRLLYPSVEHWFSM